jgi:hypothetical protein
LDLADVEAGREAVRRQLVRRRDDRLDIAAANALDDELEQIPQVPTTHLRAGGLVARMASIELGNGFVDDSILGAGEDC